MEHFISFHLFTTHYEIQGFLDVVEKKEIINARYRITLETNDHKSGVVQASLPIQPRISWSMDSCNYIRFQAGSARAAAPFL